MLSLGIRITQCYLMAVLCKLITLAVIATCLAYSFQGFYSYLTLVEPTQPEVRVIWLDILLSGYIFTRLWLGVYILYILYINKYNEFAA